MTLVDGISLLTISFCFVSVASSAWTYMDNGNLLSAWVCVIAEIVFIVLAGVILCKNHLL